MLRPPKILVRSPIRTASLALMAMAFLTSAVLWATVDVSANHPVLVEGNCLGTGAAQRTIVPAGTCGDYDGDGRIGTAEDDDEPDRVFGTINVALGAGGLFPGTGANQNGKVTIVRSGNYPEVVTITAANGNVILEGAPGVEANIDAIVQGVPGGAARQALPGIIVNAPRDRFVEIRNVTSRNWTSGIQVLGDSQVDIQSVRLDSNVNFGVEVRDNARVTIAKSEITGTGRRVGGGTDFPRANTPMPGTGIQFLGNSSGTVFLTTVSHSFGDGISNDSRRGNVCAYLVNVFNNRRDFDRVRRSSTSAPCDGGGDKDND